MQKRTRKIIILLAVVVLMTVCFAFGASAETWGDYEYTVLDDGTVAITGYTGNDSEIVIPEEIDDKAVAVIGEDAFLGRICLAKVEIPEGVEVIEDNAFRWCYGLEEFIVDEANENYLNDEYGVLYNKEKTALIKYPSMSKNETYEIASSTKEIKAGAFEYVYDIIEISVPEGVLKIGDSAFSGCMKLESIILPSTLKTIENRAFEACISLKDITIPENVSYISGNAFMDTANENVYIKSMDTKYGEYPVFESSFTVNGSCVEIAELYQKMQFADNMEEVYKCQEEIMKRLSYFDNYEYKGTGTIYCHSGSTAEAYAIENGVDYVLTHFFKGEWTYDYDNMVRTRKCIHCDELETEPLETTENEDVEIIEPVNPDTDFDVDEIEKNSDNYIIIDEALSGGIEGDYEILKAFDITLKNSDGVHVQPDGTVKVKLPLDWTKDGIYKVYRVNDDGTLTDMNAYREGSHMVFETDHFSVYVIVDESEKTAQEEPDTSDCNCICHKEGLFFEILADVFKFVAKLLGVFPVCDCGIAHY